jgi:2-methylaconitate cis-trans-isomerase PrpF
MKTGKKALVSNAQGISTENENDAISIGEGMNAVVQKAALVRTVRKIMQGELYLPDYLFQA